MSNIIGEGFKEYVAKQVNLRQEVHGKKNRTRKELLYLNSRTSWIKLASGVSVEQSRLDLIPGITNSTRYVDQGLAKNFILFNGTQEFNKSPKSGIVGNSKISPNPAYGMLFNEGDTKNFGIVPMPGIESVDVKTLEKGSIKRATVKIKAYNKTQFDVIDVLYLRLGYTLLLEWGDSHYLDNNSLSDPVTQFQNTILSNRWFDSTSPNITTEVSTNQFKMLEVIEKEREKYSGCYDALFGRIVNFKWTFESDGSYSITLDIISLGDVIESLKMNIPAMLPPTEEEKNNDSEEEIITAYQPRPLNNIVEQMIDSLRKVSDPYYEGYDQEGFFEGVATSAFEQVTSEAILGPISSRVVDAVVPLENRYRYKQLFTNERLKNSKEITIKTQGSNSSLKGNFAGITLPHELIDSTNFKIYYSNGDLEDQNSIAYHKSNKKGDVKPIDFLQMNFQPSEYQYYIRFGAFLKLLQNKIFPHYNQKNDQPIIKMDCRVHDNLMYYVPNMISIDPRVCIIRSDGFRKSDERGYIGGEEKIIDVYPEIEPFQTQKGSDSSYGYVMNIYINFWHITEMFKKVDKNGDLMLGDFLRGLCGDINRSLGGVNNLEPKIDPSTNTYTIYDRTNLPEKDQLIKNTNYEFEIFGYNLKKTPTTSNFIHNAGITTEITNDYAIMTTIGATANSSVVGEDSTSFSKWNIGIIDRFKKTLSTGDEPINETQIKNLQNTRQVKENYYKLISQGLTPDQNEFAFLGLSRQYDSESSLGNFLAKNQFISRYSKTLNIDKDGNPVGGGMVEPEGVQRPYFIDSELISSNLNIIPNFYKEIFKIAYNNQLEINKKNPKSSSQGGFMPFNLNLEVDGISGVKIYSKLKISNRFLPSNYPQSLEFITTDVTHILSNNKWITKLNTIGMPANVLTTKNIKENFFPSSVFNPYVTPGLGFNPGGEVIQTNSEFE